MSSRVRQTQAGQPRKNQRAHRHPQEIRFWGTVQYRKDNGLVSVWPFIMTLHYYRLFYGAHKKRVPQTSSSSSWYCIVLLDHRGALIIMVTRSCNVRLLSTPSAVAVERNKEYCTIRVPLFCGQVVCCLEWQRRSTISSKRRRVLWWRRESKIYRILLSNAVADHQIEI